MRAATAADRALGALRIRREEVAPAAWSALYFFSLLSSYYVLRPVRDEMGVAAGVEHMQWLFTGTFLAMLAVVPLFGWAASRLPRHRLLPAVYGFFIANIALFFLLFHLWRGSPWLAAAFFIWLSVFNLFVVSVFWSFMADIYSNLQAKRLFGIISAGGSAGAITGPALTTLLAERLGPANLLPVSAAFLALALICMVRLGAWARSRPGHGDRRVGGIGGGVWEGIRAVVRSRYLIGISGFIWLYTTLATFLYFQQASIVQATFSGAGERTAVFAAIDLGVNALTVFVQLLVTGRLVQRLGLPVALALVPAGLMAGFAALGTVPVFGVLVAVQVLRRAGSYAVTKPGREMLFTPVPSAEKYKAKNFIDTVVYRGGDALSGWLYAGLSGLGLGLAGVAWLAVPLAGLWLALGVALARHRASLAWADERQEAERYGEAQ